MHTCSLSTQHHDCHSQERAPRWSLEVWRRSGIARRFCCLCCCCCCCRRRRRRRPVIISVSAAAAAVNGRPANTAGRSHDSIKEEQQQQQQTGFSTSSICCCGLPDGTRRPRHAGSSSSAKPSTRGTGGDSESEHNVERSSDDRGCCSRCACRAAVPTEEPRKGAPAKGPAG